MIAPEPHDAILLAIVHTDCDGPGRPENLSDLGPDNLRHNLDKLGDRLPVERAGTAALAPNECLCLLHCLGRVKTCWGPAKPPRPQPVFWLGHVPSQELRVTWPAINKVRDRPVRFQETACRAPMNRGTSMLYNAGCLHAVLRVHRERAPLRDEPGTEPWPDQPGRVTASAKFCQTGDTAGRDCPHAPRIGRSWVAGNRAFSSGSCASRLMRWAQKRQPMPQVPPRRAGRSASHTVRWRCPHAV